MTLLPSARVKRIMQEDEDVGKMASNVPLVIARATELFLIDLIKKTNAIAEEKQSKSINLSHLCECVKQNTAFDFLVELVQNKMAENPPEERKRAKKDEKDAKTKKEVE
ncbi:DNA polymerase epsilon subunit C, putative [Entamoeba invadens IP1]|uniref:DNA polymerase epsilon subunit C, putative n=1 Tax=Entamoeba invadens IP1 TaxID=370355 RepID=UPI0002C3CF60|nr:DNA polymerase epsilon subunit C, putative [Entamoeba invadens IP1]ELP94160.1 DNA polymerase epsilon subunit C, putative [Entamoeba invadens IP1]|eukprot:XP_004260931.1 DNA polymerase epsilon subunit C, putative [Entamoeba invadens IP1]